MGLGPLQSAAVPSSKVGLGPHMGARALCTSLDIFQAPRPWRQPKKYPFLGVPPGEGAFQLLPASLFVSLLLPAICWVNCDNSCYREKKAVRHNALRLFSCIMGPCELQRCSALAEGPFMALLFFPVVLWGLVFFRGRHHRMSVLVWLH